MPKSLTDIKNQIIAVSRKLLYEQGYNEVNMRKIASECGIATGTLYNYYSSKQEIVGEILKSDWEMMLRRLNYAMKSCCKEQDKLECFFMELRNYTKSVHGIWSDELKINAHEVDMKIIRQIKESLRQDLAIKIKEVIKDLVDDKGNLDFISEFIARVIFSYSMEENFDYNNLKTIFSAILGQNNK